ncbi:MAG TPA: flagellin [Nocardioidaceae bacterium]
MGLRINQNIAAMNAYRNLSVTDSQMSKSLEKLSSGFRINRAADDAAGLAISEGLRSQIGGLKVAVRNTQDGISVVQTAEGALTETHSILQRMRDLSVQAANDGGLSADAKGNIQSEMDQLKKELTRIADTTQFNGTKLLDGGYKGTFQVGANAGETISVAQTQDMSASGLSVDTVDVTAVAADAATQTATGDGDGTSAEETMTVTAKTPTDELNGTVTWNGETVNLASIDFSQTGAADKVAAALGLAAGSVVFTAGDGSTTNDELVISSDTGDFANYETSFTQRSGAEYGIDQIDEAIGTVSTVRADLGAFQNRFEHTVNNLSVAVENLSASESRIRDTDMASEMVNFTRAQILSQAGTAMLAQANQIPQGVLRLLQ